MATNAYPGKHCQRIGLSVDNFLESENAMMPRITNITKGTIYELHMLRREHNWTWIEFYDRVKALCDSTFTVTFGSFKVIIGRVDKKRAELTRNKKLQELEELFMQKFCTVAPKQKASEHIEVKMVPNSQVDELQKALVKEKTTTEQLCTKLGMLSVRNVNKRIKRRDLKITQSQSEVKQKNSELKHQSKTIEKLENRLDTANTSVHNLRQKLY